MALDIKSEIEIKEELIDSLVEYVYVEPVINSYPLSSEEDQSLENYSEEKEIPCLSGVKNESIEDKCPLKYEDEPEVLTSIHHIESDTECSENVLLRKVQDSEFTKLIARKQSAKVEKIFMSAFGAPMREFLSDPDEPRTSISDVEDCDDIIEIDADSSRAERFENRTKTVSTGGKASRKPSKTPQKKQEIFLSPKQPPMDRVHVQENPRILEPYDTRNYATAAGKDECSTYGDHVANKLRKLDDRSRAVVQHKINNIIFEAEMKKFSTMYPSEEET